ncbi:MAG: MFS transporter [Gammaproteobacteria bacterium]|nr:MFS transporter [Gammaproteobacteria bacterium]
MNRQYDARQKSWLLYDFANSAFYTTVMAGFFPVFFKSYWSSGADAAQSTFYLGVGNSLASLVTVLLAPVLGALADVGNLKTRLLGLTMLIGVAATAGLYWIGEGQWLLAVAMYALASVAASSSLVFYDALLVDVAKPEDQHRLSTHGFAWGYLGGGVLFAVNVAMTLKPAWFGLANAAEGVRWSFISVAIWWAVFSLPILTQLKAPQVQRKAFTALLKESIGTLKQTAQTARQYRQVWLFLLAFFFYIDGVHTVIMMAVDYGLSIGLPQETMITALLLTQFVGFPAGMLMARLAGWFGPLRCIYACIAVYAAATILAVLMSAQWQFYALAALIGLVQGGVQALSRSVYANMIPEDQAGAFFGFYNILGKAAAVLGPLMVGVVALATDSTRMGMLSLLVLFGLGAWFLRKVEL